MTISGRRIHDLAKHERPREKIEEKGPAALEDHELVAAILGIGTKGHDVFKISRQVAGMLKTRLPAYSELIQIEGIGPSKASVLMACFELARRYGRFEEQPKVRIVAPEDLLKIPEVWALKTRKQEHFLAITLNGASEVISARTITMGLLNHSLVHPREVFADAITDRAAAIIGAHNHPSGSTEPSTQDIEVTRQLAQAGTILGINLLDHVIVTKDQVTSLRELGYL